MAIWQFNTELLPIREVMKAYNGIVPKKLEIIEEIKQIEPSQDEQLQEKVEEMIDTFNLYWSESQLNIDSIIPLIDEMLGKTDFSGKDFYTWGKSDSNYIFIAFNEANRNISRVEILIDLRYQPKKFVLEFLKLADIMKAVILDVKGRLYEPKYNLLKESIEDSNAYKYVKNPNQFLTDLESGKILPE